MQLFVLYLMIMLNRGLFPCVPQVDGKDEVKCSYTRKEKGLTFFADIRCAAFSGQIRKIASYAAPQECFMLYQLYHHKHLDLGSRKTCQRWQLTQLRGKGWCVARSRTYFEDESAHRGDVTVGTRNVECTKAIPLSTKHM
jgi:hypothetical protein